MAALETWSSSSSSSTWKSSVRAAFRRNSPAASTAARRTSMLSSVQPRQHLFLPAFVGGQAHGDQRAGLPVRVLTPDGGLDQRGNFRTRRIPQRFQRPAPDDGLIAAVDLFQQGVFHLPQQRRRGSAPVRPVPRNDPGRRRLRAASPASSSSESIFRKDAASFGSSFSCSRRMASKRTCPSGSAEQRTRQVVERDQRVVGRQVVEAVQQLVLLLDRDARPGLHHGLKRIGVQIREHLQRTRRKGRLLRQFIQHAAQRGLCGAHYGRTTVAGLMKSITFT